MNVAAGEPDTLKVLLDLISQAEALPVDTWVPNPYRYQDDNLRRVGVFEVPGGFVVAVHNAEDESLKPTSSTLDRHEAEVLATSVVAEIGRSYLERHCEATVGLTSWTLELAHSTLTDQWPPLTREATRFDWTQARRAAAALFHAVPSVIELLICLTPVGEGLDDPERVHEWLDSELSGEAAVECIRAGLTLSEGITLWNGHASAVRTLAALRPHF